MQTSGQHDVKSSGKHTSHSKSERLSQLVSYKGSLPPDLATIVDAWPRLPEAVRASILMLVKAASGGG